MQNKLFLLQLCETCLLSNPLIFCHVFLNYYGVCSSSHFQFVSCKPKGKCTFYSGSCDLFLARLHRVIDILLYQKKKKMLGRKKKNNRKHADWKHHKPVWCTHGAGHRGSAAGDQNRPAHQWFHPPSSDINKVRCLRTAPRIQKKNNT